jgi:hypothetical protein
LLSRLRLVLADRLAMSLFRRLATTFSFADILDGGVLLCRLPNVSSAKTALAWSARWRSTPTPATRSTSPSPHATPSTRPAAYGPTSMTGT